MRGDVIVCAQFLGKEESFPVGAGFMPARGGAFDTAFRAGIKPAPTGRSRLIWIIRRYSCRYVLDDVRVLSFYSFCQYPDGLLTGAYCSSS